MSALWDYDLAAERLARWTEVMRTADWRAKLVPPTVRAKKWNEQRRRPAVAGDSNPIARIVDDIDWSLDVEKVNDRVDRFHRNFHSEF